MSNHLSAPRLLNEDSLIEELSSVLAQGVGPLFLDTERASSYRYDDRAFLIQIYRHKSGAFLIDPEVAPEATRALASIVNTIPWVLHSSANDLPSLASLGWKAPFLFDTQLAGQFLGLSSVSLESMVKLSSGVDIPKKYSSADWSRRPLPQGMLKYAIEDVIYMPAILDYCASSLQDNGYWEAYIQESAHINKKYSFPLRHSRWYELKGIGKIKNASTLSVLRTLFFLRLTLAQDKDCSPSSIMRHSYLLDCAQLLTEESTLSESHIHSQIRFILRQHSGSHLSPTEIENWILPLQKSINSPLSNEEYRAFIHRRQSPTYNAHHCPSKVADWEEKNPQAYRLYHYCTEELELYSEHTLYDNSLLITKKDLKFLVWNLSFALNQSHSLDFIVDKIISLLSARDYRPWQIRTCSDIFLPAIDRYLRLYFPKDENNTGSHYGESDGQFLNYPIHTAPIFPLSEHEEYIAVEAQGKS